MPAVIVAPSSSGWTGGSDGEPLGGGVGPRVLVALERAGAAVAVGHLDRHDLLGEAALVAGRGGSQVRVERPLVGGGPADAGDAGRVLADRDRHVHGRGVGRLGVARRHPRHRVAAAAAATLVDAGFVLRLSVPPATTTWSMPALDRAGRDLHRAQPGRAVAVVGQARHLGHAEARAPCGGRSRHRPGATRRPRGRRCRRPGCPSGRRPTPTATSAELEGVDVGERALVGTADRGAGGGDDHGLGHGGLLGS